MCLRDVISVVGSHASSSISGSPSYSGLSDNRPSPERIGHLRSVWHTESKRQMSHVLLFSRPVERLSRVMLPVKRLSSVRLPVKRPSSVRLPVKRLSSVMLPVKRPSSVRLPVKRPPVSGYLLKGSPVSGYR